MFGRKHSKAMTVISSTDASPGSKAVTVRELDREKRLAMAQALSQRLDVRGNDVEGFVLIGKGTHITGEIGNCSVVEIQGTLEGNVAASILIVREGGAFKGEVQAEQAEIHGEVDGRATVHGLLDVRASGRVTGDVTYETLAVAAGAHLAGRLQSPATIDGLSEPLEPEPDMRARANGHAPGTNGSAYPPRS